MEIWRNLNERNADEGNGNATGAQAIPNNDLGAVEPNRLRELYMDADFIRSYTLPQLEDQNILG